MQFLHIVEISENKTKHGKLLDVQGEILIPKTERKQSVTQCPGKLTHVQPLSKELERPQETDMILHTTALCKKQNDKCLLFQNNKYLLC
jgi:hypothetical protein